MYIYILYTYICITLRNAISWAPGGKARVHNSSYTDAVFEFRVHEVSEIWTGLSHSFTKDDLLHLQGQ